MKRIEGEIIYKSASAEREKLEQCQSNFASISRVFFVAVTINSARDGMTQKLIL